MSDGYRPIPPSPGDVRQYGDYQAICDERTLYFEVYDTSDQLRCRSRSWDVVLCRVFGVLPTTVGGIAECEDAFARQLAEVKTWNDPDAGERKVLNSFIVSNWIVVLVLEDGERVELGEHGRVLARRMGTLPKKAEPPGPPAQAPAPPADDIPPVAQSAGFELPALPADKPRTGAVDDDGQGLLF